MSEHEANESAPSGPPPIPPFLHSAYLEAPFRSCSVCGEDLLLGRIPYQVQKVWRGGEVVFEMAVCARCAANLMREFSQESMAAMQAFHQQHYRPEETVALCHFCRRAVTTGTEHEIGAACAGSRLLRPAVVICGECNGRMQERLSRKTREAWGDFVEQNFPGVPRAMEPETTPMLF